MRTILVLIVGLNFCFAYSQQREDPTVMTVADMEVPLSEFLFLAQNSEVNLSDKKSLDNFVEMFKTFKLKIVEALSLGIQESLAFQQELEYYYAELMASYLSDKEGEERVMRTVYERGKEVLTLNHILFLLPEKSLPKDTLEIFNKANAFYRRIVAGEDFPTLGWAFAADENANAYYEEDYIIPLQAPKAVEDVAYTLSEGEISAPIRSPYGFHVIQLRRKIANPGSVQVAHILIQSPEYAPEDDETLLKRANEVYAKIKAGEDFGELANTYSTDENTRAFGGVLPYFGVGNMVSPFEQSAFSLENIGDVSGPVQTRYGYHLIKLLDRKGYPSFDEMAPSIYTAMKEGTGEWSRELSKSFDEQLKEELNFTFYQEAYNELLNLCDDYFPTDTGFYNLASTMSKPIMRMNERNFPQDEFAEYIRIDYLRKHPLTDSPMPMSNQTYSKDYLNEMFLFFVREIATHLGKIDLEERNPEFRKMLNEYYEGILLFEISSNRVWNQPVEEQTRIEQDWIKELNEKYEVEINWNVLNNLKNYLN